MLRSDFTPGTKIFVQVNKDRSDDREEKSKPEDNKVSDTLRKRRLASEEGVLSPILVKGREIIGDLADGVRAHRAARILNWISALCCNARPQKLWEWVSDQLSAWQYYGMKNISHGKSERLFLYCSYSKWRRNQSRSTLPIDRNPRYFLFIHIWFFERRRMRIFLLCRIQPISFSPDSFRWWWMKLYFIIVWKLTS